MKMKRKITLGLLVFFVGLLMTACGSDESSPAPAASPTTTTTETTNTSTINGLPTPTSTGTLPSTCTSNCGTTQSVRIIVTNKEAFAEMVGLNTQGTFGTNVDFFGNNTATGQVLNLFGNAALGCGLNFFESWLASLGGGTSSGTCGGSTTTTSTNGIINNGVVSVADSYNVTISAHANNILTGAINLNNGQLYSFELRPNANNSAWIAVNKNPPMGMLGNYQVFTNLGSGDVQVGYLAN